MEIETLYFKDEIHKDYFLEMIKSMYLSEAEMNNPTVLIKQQVAFCYLIALYQKDYEKYEGDYFYVELGEELSLGGPTYLLDERYGERIRDCEKIIPIACRLLGQEDIKTIVEDEKDILASFEVSINKELVSLGIWMNKKCENCINY